MILLRIGCALALLLSSASASNALGWEDHHPRRPLKLRLVHVINLNGGSAFEPGLGGPGRLPPGVNLGDVTPRIVEDESALVFISPTGSITKRIPLRHDGNVSIVPTFSNNRRAVTLAQTLKATILGPEAAEKAEGGEFAATYTTYNDDGAQLAVCQGASGERPVVSDNGIVVLSNESTGLLKFYGARNGALLKQFQLLGPYGSGAPVVAISGDGAAVAVAAPIVTLRGQQAPFGTPPRFLDLALHGDRNVAVALYDRTGGEIWRKSILGVGDAVGAAVADGGTSVFVATTGYVATGLPTPQAAVDAGSIVDSTTVQTKPQWRFGTDGVRYRSDLKGFELGAQQSPNVRIAYPDGRTAEVVVDNGVGLSDLDVRARSSTDRYVAYLVRYRSRLILAITDRQGGLLFAQNARGSGAHVVHSMLKRILGPPSTDRDLKKTKRGDSLVSVQLSPDSQYVSVRLDGQVRIYAIES